LPACRTDILRCADDGDTDKNMEQAMLALVIEYSKLLLLFLLIGSVVTVSRFERRKQSPLPSGDRSTYSL
jgi:hypothetical protein